MKRTLIALIAVPALAGLAGCTGSASAQTASATVTDLESAVQVYFNAAHEGDVEKINAVRPKECPSNGDALAEVKQMLGDARMIAEDVTVEGNTGRIRKVRLEGGNPSPGFVQMFAAREYSANDADWTFADGKWSLAHCPAPAADDEAEEESAEEEAVSEDAADGSATDDGAVEPGADDESTSEDAQE